MGARDMGSWETSICDVVSTDEEEEVNIRGHRLSELIGQVSFADAMFLLLQGRLPSTAEARVLDALLVASIEHGIAPPSMISRCLASYGSPIQAAIAGGVLAFGDWMGGAGETFAELLARHVGPHIQDRQPVTDEILAEEARNIVTRTRSSNERIAGFGIPLHGADPRAPKLLELADEEGVSGPHCRLATAIEAALAEASGRPIPMNLDGVGAALILDLGFPWHSARLFIITPRTVSMGAHYLEELEQDTRWRHIAKDRITYRP